MKFGKVSLWSVAGPAYEVCTQMMQNLNSEALRIDPDVRLLDDKPYGEKEMEEFRVSGHFFYMGFYFLGTCRRKATPVLILYSKHKYTRHQLVGSMRGLDWFDPNKSGVIATTWCNSVIRQQIIEDSVRYSGWERGFAEEVY